MDPNDRGRDRESLKEEMERDTAIRRDTQIRGSLGVPPSGGESGQPQRPDERSIPEFERNRDRERMSER